MATQRLNRFKTELSMLINNPPPGITCRQEDLKSDVIMAEITGPPGSPFENGTFTVEVSLSDRYPFSPPVAQFLTPVYHPNVDTNGRICLSGLKPKPAGTWNCSMSIALILSAIRLLLSEPNLGDPLMSEIAAEYKDDFPAFRAKAEAKTKQYAVKNGEKGAANTENGDNRCNLELEISQSLPGNKNTNSVSAAAAKTTLIKKNSESSLSSKAAPGSNSPKSESSIESSSLSSMKAKQNTTTSVSTRPSTVTTLTTTTTTTKAEVFQDDSHPSCGDSSTESDDDIVFIRSKAKIITSPRNPSKKPKLTE